MSGSISAFRAAWLIARFRLRRMSNAMAVLRLRRPPSGTPARAGTARRRRGSAFVPWFFGTMALLAFANFSRQTVVNLSWFVETGETPGAASGGMQASWVPFDEILADDALVGALGGHATLLFALASLMFLAARDWAQQDWDLEWLVTLPIERRTLLWSRVLERSVTTPLAIYALWPYCSVLAWYEAGARWSAPLLGAVAAVPLLLLASLVRTIVDTGLHLKLPHARLRNLQAVASLLASPVLLLAMAFSLAAAPPFIYELPRGFPAAATWLVPGLVVRVLAAPDVRSFATLVAFYVAQTAVLLIAGIALLERWLENGVVAAGTRESTRGAVAAGNARTAQMVSATGASIDTAVAALRTQVATEPRWFASPIQRRDLRLLGRDRNYMVQSLLVPIVVIGMQLLVNGTGASVFTGGHAALAALAFGLSAYLLLLSASQALNTEGAALWLLYSLPRPLAGVLVDKLLMWALVAGAYATATFAIGIALGHGVDAELVSLFVLVLAGVPIYTTVAIALGVMGTDPLATTPQARFRVGHSYLYMTLAGFYSYALFASEWSQRLALIVLSVALAASLWQKMTDQLPFLLDSAAAPPARVSTSDGLIAATMFFVVQGVSTIAMHGLKLEMNAVTLAIAFAIAGAVTYVAFRWTYFRSKTSGVPSLLGADRRIGRALAWGVPSGVAAAGVAFAYTTALARLGLAPDETDAAMEALQRSAWFVATAVVAAPLFEEFIFRGLVFGGLRRSMPAWLATLASAAVFAIVHPPIAMAPVFLVGVLTAVAYARTGALLAPMIVHAVHNAIVVGTSFALD